MKNTNFETLYLPAEMYENFISLATNIFSFMTIILLILIILRFRFNIRIPFIHRMFTNLPKLVVSGLLFLFIFCLDYETKQLHFPSYDNMLLSTFAVGFFALYEFLDTIVDTISDILDK